MKSYLRVVCFPRFFRDYHTRDRGSAEIFEYLELLYNRERIYQSLDYETPLMYEKGIA